MAENARPGSAEAQPDPVAVAAARLRDENTILLVAQGELRTVKPRGEPLKVAEAKAAVAEAELGVAKAKLLVTEVELEQARKSCDEAAVVEAKVTVEKSEVAVAEAKVAVAEAKWASAGPNEKGSAKSILDRAIRGLEVTQDAYERALRAGADAVGAAATHPGAEAGMEFGASRGLVQCGLGAAWQNSVGAFGSVWVRWTTDHPQPHFTSSVVLIRLSILIPIYFSFPFRLLRMRLSCAGGNWLNSSLRKVIFSPGSRRWRPVVLPQKRFQGSLMVESTRPLDHSSSTDCLCQCCRSG